MLLIVCVLIWLLWVGFLVSILKLDKPPHNKKISKNGVLGICLAVAMQLALTYFYNEYPDELAAVLCFIAFLIVVLVCFLKVFF